MSFEGTYEELQDFLLRVRNLARLVTVNEVTYEEAARGGETTAVNRGVEDLLMVEIVAETYVQPAAGGATIPTEQGKAGKGKAGESKAKSKAGESKAGKSKAGEGKAGKS